MTMRRTHLIVSTLALIVASAWVTPAVAQTPAVPAPPVVVASGESRIKVAPDQAWAIVSLQTRDSKAPEARRLGAVAMTTVTAALKKSGGADAIQTIGFALQPEYEYVNGRQRMKGFLVSNQVQVRIDDVSRVADVLDEVGSLSLPASSMVTIAGLRFDLKNRAGVEREALKSAVEDAMARAKAMAAGAGVALGRTLRIDEGVNQVPKYGPEPMLMASRAVRGGAEVPVETPIEPSDIEIRANVTLTIEIK